MKPATKARQALLASLLAGATLVSSGCSSGGFPLASMNPFSKPAPASGTVAGSTGRLSESIASTTTSIGATAKSAFGKTTSALASVFARDNDLDDVGDTDPLSLANMPTKVGPEVFVANGQLWESTGDYGKAMESYTKALESEPNNAPALTSIARLHFREGKHAQAADFFRRAIDQSPEDAGLHNDLGLTLSKLNDHAGSTKSLEKALKLAPGTSRYANNLASIKFEEGDTSRAFQVLEQNNKPAVAHFNMAYLHFKSGQTTEARGHLTKVLRDEAGAADDPAIQRAVERSRDMLAQIDGAAAPVARAAPQATIAGGQFFNNALQKPPVKQAKPSGTAEASVAPPATTVSAIVAPPATTVSAIVAPPATTVSAIAAPPSDPQAGEVPTERPVPIKPAEPDADALPPSFPFSLPESFDDLKTK